jgi:hypothetical protein
MLLSMVFTRVVFLRLVSLVFFAGLALSLTVYPMEGHWLAAILLVYAALLFWRPVLWLFALPALIPVLDLAPYTGWFFLEEIDLLLMITAGFCYWNLQYPAPSAAQWPVSFKTGLSLLLVALCIGLWRGLQPLPAPDANAFNNYLSSYNAVRVGKAWFWVFVLLPPLKQAAGPQLQGLRQYLVPGMLTGLLLVCGAAIRERVQFPGLLNFASDYRITAPFSAMHTGGAALDGYLALSFPLLAVWLFGRVSTLRTAAALALLPLALYTGLATFSRGLYLAYAAAVTILLALPSLAVLSRRRGADAAARSGASFNTTPIVGILSPVHPPVAPPFGRHWFAAASLSFGVLLTMAVLNAVFSTSGYRGYGAALILLAAMLLLSAQALKPVTLASGLICGLMLAGMLAWLLPVGSPPYSLLKTPYLLFICSALAFAVAMAHAAWGQANLQPLAVFAYAGLLLNAAWIALYHAGPVTVAPSSALLMLALLPIAINLARRRPLWTPTRRKLAAALAALLVLGSIVPIYNGYYVNVRFSTSSNDLATRLRHWAQALAMMDDGASTAFFGMGLGKFPVTYYWRNRQGEVPPSYRYLDVGSNRYLRLSAGEYSAGYGELLRMLQKVRVQPGRRYLLGVDVWNAGPPGFLHINLCQRQLLYPLGCIPVPLKQIPSAPHWQRYQFELRSGVLDSNHAPVQLEVAAEGRSVSLDIDNISLRSLPDNHELLRNGSFSDANNYWFFSSDRYHLPWHVKNLGLNLYFDMGWPGLLAIAIMLASAGTTLLKRARAERGGCESAAWLAALFGFQIVGLFDSLIDVPRITFLSTLLLCAAALQPDPPFSRATQ